MSLITIAGLLALTDISGKMVPDLTLQTDVANLHARMIAAQVNTTFAGDPDQAYEWYPYARGLYQAVGLQVLATGAPANAIFGGGGVSGGSFGAGSGGFSRSAVFSNFFTWLEGIRGRLVTHAAQDGISGIADAGSFASYYNTKSRTITGATNATPIVIASAAHGFTTGQQITIAGVVGNTAANGAWSITVVDADHFSLSGSVGNGAYTSGGTAVNPFACLFSPDFASAWWYAYGKQLDPSTVFAPAGIVMAHFAITGSGTGTLSNNAATNWPAANGYTVPAPSNTGGSGTTDAGIWNSATAYTMGPPIPVVLYNGAWYVAVAGSTNVTPGTDPTKWTPCTFGNNLYLGSMPMAQAFAACKTPAVKITTTINNAASVTVTAPNQMGVSKTWTATIDNAIAGTVINLTPANPGDRINGAPTAITVSGPATAGALDVVTTAERTP